MSDIKNPDIQTILKTVEKATQIAIVLPRLASIDLLSAGVALATTINSQKINAKKTASVFSVSEVKTTLPFLKNPPSIYSTLNTSNQLVVKISNQNALPSELKYDKTADGLSIYITPDEGKHFQEGDVSVLPSGVKFDLLIILGAVNFEELGSIFTDNTKLFFETPNINIDINPANEFYGTINFVQTVASSVSEVVMGIIEEFPDALKDETINTALLAGIISQTSSFRDPKTTPQVMLKASRLVALGAKQQEIIQHLFKTKPLPLLQLWGRALARLSAYPEKQMLTAVVTTSDLEKTAVAVESFPIVVRDIAEMITGYSLIVFVAELSANSVQVVLAGLPFEDLADLSVKLNATSIPARAPLSGKYEYISAHLPSGLAKTQELLNEIIKNRNSVV